GQLLATPGAVATEMFRAYSAPARLLGKLTTPFLQATLRRLYNITPDTVAQAHEGILAAIDRLEHVCESDPTRYLVGNKLTLADITAAALLGPLVAPPQSPWHTLSAPPAAVIELREALCRRPVGQWVIQRYKSDREHRVST